MTPLFLYGRRDSNTLYVSLPKGATGQFVIYRPMKRKALAAGLRQPPSEGGAGGAGGAGARLANRLVLPVTTIPFVTLN